jgi:hypothetical protein
MYLHETHSRKKGVEWRQLAVSLCMEELGVTHVSESRVQPVGAEGRELDWVTEHELKHVRQKCSEFTLKAVGTIKHF